MLRALCLMLLPVCRLACNHFQAVTVQDVRPTTDRGSVAVLMASSEGGLNVCEGQVGAVLTRCGQCQA
jgi:hypothetical protein